MIPITNETSARYMEAFGRVKALRRSASLLLHGHWARSPGKLEAITGL